MIRSCGAVVCSDHDALTRSIGQPCGRGAFVSSVSVPARGFLVYGLDTIKTMSQMDPITVLPRVSAQTD